jgi:hypothetical protein
LKSIGFYSDWKSSNYELSIALTNDVMNAIDKNYITKYEMTNRYGFQVDRFAITEQDKNVFKD